jgi:MinD-like ATPase involved in chromosome partitioning or flagellar assembly
MSGRIVTFYSYKGGTGRSMAVANVAWILASAGKRVLILDWDLEAPGAHRYLHPFLNDPELERTPGLIDFFHAFAAAARDVPTDTVPIDTVPTDTVPTDTGGPWFEDVASLVPYTLGVDWEFPGDGCLELVGAGRQDAAYALRVTSFDWQRFYSQLGGGVFLEAVKRRLRQQYDYVLVDSRTGVSDIAGICTIQLPDELVVCYTLNDQSIRGAAAVAESADRQRRKANGEPSLRIWPVATRVELAEKERLEAARGRAQAAFQGFIRHMPRTKRADYWGAVEVLYQPFYAYEEVLAVFAERRRSPLSLLAAMERLVGFLTEGKVGELAWMPDAHRREGLARFSPGVPAARPTKVTPGTGPTVFVSYAAADRELATMLVEGLRARRVNVAWDQDLTLGAPWEEEFHEMLSRSPVMILLQGEELRTGQAEEMGLALAQGKRVIPVVAPGVSPTRLPLHLRQVLALQLPAEGLEQPLDQLAKAVRPDGAPLYAADADDPQKGQWGGRAQVWGRELVAAVTAPSPSWFRVDLEVRPNAGAAPIDGEVTFHLHPTFVPSARTVTVVDGVARTTVHAWGAFTVGAECDGCRTQLELDLATLVDTPAAFRER